jgi:hypothetical protein
MITDTSEATGTSPSREEVVSRFAATGGPLIIDMMEVDVGLDRWPDRLRGLELDHQREFGRVGIAAPPIEGGARLTSEAYKRTGEEKFQIMLNIIP